MFLLVGLFGFLYILLNTLQTAFVVSGNKSLVPATHFIAALMWVFIITQIVAAPVLNGVSYAIGSALGMYLAQQLNLTLLFNKAK